MSAPFDYPPVPHERRHGPKGYATYESFRDWLRDEFSFRCVYCLVRERWTQVGAIFEIDHFMPVKDYPDLANCYDNLLYACATCNGAKRRKPLSDPLTVLTAARVHVAEDGTMQTDDLEAASLIEKLELNSPRRTAFRKLFIDFVALAAKGNPATYQQLMGYPDELPDLRKHKPPDGNSREKGLMDSALIRYERGDLPTCY